MKPTLCINEWPRQRGLSLPSPRVGKRDDVWLNSVAPSRKQGHAQARGDPVPS